MTAKPAASEGMRGLVWTYGRALLQREALRAITPRSVLEMSPHAEVRGAAAKAWIAVDCAADHERDALLAAIATLDAEAAGLRGERDRLRGAVEAVRAAMVLPGPVSLRRMFETWGPESRAALAALDTALAEPTDATKETP